MANKFNLRIPAVLLCARGLLGIDPLNTAHQLHPMVSYLINSMYSTLEAARQFYVEYSSKAFTCHYQLLKVTKKDLRGLVDIWHTNAIKRVNRSRK